MKNEARPTDWDRLNPDSSKFYRPLFDENGNRIEGHYHYLLDGGVDELKGVYRELEEEKKYASN